MVEIADKPSGNAYLLLFLIIVMLFFSFLMSSFGSFLGVDAPIDLESIDNPDYEVGYGFGSALFDVFIFTLNADVPLFVDIIFWIMRIMLIYLLVEVLWIG